MDELEIQELLDVIVTSSAIEFAGLANKVQMEFDTYLRSNNVIISKMDLETILFGDVSTAPKNILDKFRKEILKGLSKDISDGWSNGTLEPVRKNSVISETLLGWNLESGIKHCPDCLRRATYPKQTITEWEKIGIPRSGVTVCNDSCHCFLSA